jgi:hypothetical protein
MAHGLPGLIAYDFGQADIISRLAEGSIEFGRVVSRGTDPDNQVVPGGSSPFGITVRDVAREVNSSGDAVYDDEDVAAVMKRGPIWIKSADAGVPGDRLNYNTTTGAIGVGAPGAGEKSIPGARLETTVVQNGVAIITVQFEQDDKTPPADVTDLALVAGDTQIAATWTDPTDSDLARLLVTAVNESTGLVAGSYEVAAGTEALTVTSLTNGTAYTIRVQSVDASGNVSPGVSDSETPSA